MPVWPKSFLKFGASVMTALPSMRMRGWRRAIAIQEETFKALTPKLAATSFWREAGIKPGMRYEEFRAAVTPRRHEDLAPAIARMQEGEANVLWPGGCAFFATTSGTSTGEPRAVPVTTDMLGHFRHAIRNALLYYTTRVGHAGVMGGRHLYLAGSTALKPVATGRDVYTATLGGIVTLSLSPSVERHFFEPGAEISQMSEGLAKLEAMAARVSRADVSLIAGLPNWVLLFVEALQLANRSKGQLVNLQGIWPNLECFVHVGVPIAPFYDEMRQALGANVRFHETLAACEGFVATQDAEPMAGLRLMVDTGIFFEFVPLPDYDETRLDQSGARAVTLAEVKRGVDYVLLLTTPGGLVRYCLGDVVRFITTEPPRIAYTGRTQLRLDTFGERVSERELTDALVGVCRRHRWSLVNFHVAPRLDVNRIGQNRGAHEWWIELRRGLRETPIGPHLAVELDAELQRLNPDYAAKRKTNVIELPTVRLVMPGVFEHWLRYRGQWGGQNKTPRCRSDRMVADELAQMTNFATVSPFSDSTVARTPPHRSA